MRIAMLCPCGKRSLDTPPILDIEKILQDYAWRDFKEKSGPVEKIFLRRRDFDIEVPMNYFHFEDSETKLKQRTTKSSLPSAAGHSVPETAVLSTQFRNNTPTQQTYKFRVERTRKATLSVTFQRGFSIGGKAHFKLELPKVAGAGGDIDMRLQISKTTGETFEESMTFEVNSDINVNQQSNYTANVAFTEKEISAGFTVYTTMRMPTGTAPITIRRKRDRELYATVFVANLKEVFENYKEFAEPVDESSEDSRCSEWAIKFMTTGIVEGIRLSGQKIYLDSTSIDKTAAVPNFDDTRASLLAEAVGARHSDIFGVMTTSESDDAKDESNSAGKSFRSITDGHSETRIIKGPQIPTIITTAPSSQDSTSPSDTGTNTSGETQSLPDDKASEGRDKSGSPSPVPSPAASPGKASQIPKDVVNFRDSNTSKDGNAQKECSKVPLKETKSLSRGSKDDAKSPPQELKSPISQKSMPELRSPSPSGKPTVPELKASHQSSKQQTDESKPTKKHKVSKEDSLTRLDPTKLKAEPQKVKMDSHKVKDLSRFKPDPIKIPNIRDAPIQFSHPKDVFRQTSTPKELLKQRSDPKEFTKQMSNAKELLKQISNPEGEKVFNDDKGPSRRSYRHETLERMERVSSLSERPRILPKSGSLPRAAGHSPVEPQSSEEDSTSSLNKLSKCTSV